MALYQQDIYIANPSPYERSDYVQLDLDKLKIPPDLDEKSLTLYRIDPDNGKEEIPVPYQIDFPFGKDVGTRVMTFLSIDTPRGGEDYSEKSALFRLKEKKQEWETIQPNLGVVYFRTPNAAEPINGSNMEWVDNHRDIMGVKLFNDAFWIYFHLFPLYSPKGLSYSGSVTSTYLQIMDKEIGTGEILSPYSELIEEKIWGQVHDLFFYPLPWEQKQYHKISLIDQNYELVWSKDGPIRAIVTLKSKPMIIPYDGGPFFIGTKEIKASLYRVLYIYPSIDKSFYYMEDLFVLTDEGYTSISFCPYYFSKLPIKWKLDLNEKEYIPNYFSISEHFGGPYFGFGFASNAHIKKVEIMNNKEIYWHLSLSHNFKCIHHFMYEYEPSFNFDPFHTIVHDDPFHTIGHGWYEKIFKPLRPLNMSLNFPSPLL